MTVEIIIAYLFFLCLFALSCVISVLDDILTVCRKILYYIEKGIYKNER